MRRRDFISLAGGAAAAWPLATRAQQGERMRRVGMLMLYPENDPAGQLRATVFREGLEKFGWTVGRNLQIDYVWGVGDADWIPHRSKWRSQLTPWRHGPERLLAGCSVAVFAIV